MDNTKILDFDNAIYSILTGNTALQTIIDGEIYPVLNQGFDVVNGKDHITYETRGDNEYDKDYYRGTDIVVEIYVYAKYHDQLKTIGKAVNTALNLYKGVVLDFNILRTRFTGFEQSFVQGGDIIVYLMKLQYDVIVRIN